MAYSLKSRIWRLVGALALVLAGPLGAQKFAWHTRVGLYADNTEFFTPYRVGETLFGGQLTTWLEGHPGTRTAVRAGVFVDRRWGSDQLVDSIKPVISFRYHTNHGTGVLGTLITGREHGLLEPLMVMTREITTPIEYGAQWIEGTHRFQGQAWINWQQLNTASQREGFEVGAVLRAEPVDWLRFDAQTLWSHRGGQLFHPVPVSNNHATAIGATVRDSLGPLGEGSLSVWGAFSEGHLDPYYSSDRPANGHGWYLRADLRPWRHTDFFVIHWIGRDFQAAAGDGNYGSVGHDTAFYQSRRVYTEVGVIRRTPIRGGGGSTFDAELRFHNIDNRKSVAFFNTRWELSYRMIVRVPVDVVLR